MADEKQMPHMGEYLRVGIRRLGSTYAAVAVHMGISSAGINQYFKNPSIQIRSFWKAGVALNHNLFYDLAKIFPVPIPPDTAMNALLAEKDARIADLEKELAIYKRIVEKSS